MNNENLDRQYVPWTFLDTWLGVFLMFVVIVGIVVFSYFYGRANTMQTVAVVGLELAYMIPVATIFLWRPEGWKYLGYRKFTWAAIGLGCGLVILGYSIALVHNLILVKFGVDTQGEMIMKLFNSLEQPGWLIFAGSIMAPFVEETFFRGFLFQGLRQRMGWLWAALLSSAIFGVAHGDPVAFIPTFVLGFVFSFLFQRSNSIWPGIIMHFLVNSFAFCGLLLAKQFPIQ